MAVTSITAPASYTSAHDSLWHIASSGNSAQSSFKYVFDLQIGGITVATLKNYPDSGGYGVLDVAPIVRNYLGSGFNPSGSSLLHFAGSFLFVDYLVQFREEFGGNPPGVIDDSSSAKGWNYSLNPFRTSISTYANKFLTTRDRSAGEVMNGEKFYITYFNANLSAVTATIQKINEDGSNSGSSSTGGTLSSLSSLLLDLSPYAINTYLGTSFITSSTYGYKVTIGSDTMIMKQVCAPRFTPVNLVFQNQFGGYDTFGFRLLSRQQKSFKRTTYQTAEYQRSGTTMAHKSSSGVHYGGVQALATQIDYSYLVTSDYVSAVDYALGAELLASNEVYLHITTGANEDYYPIIMKDTNYQEKVSTSDKLFNYQLQFDLGQKQFSQYR
jgi:hypothetical protein